MGRVGGLSGLGLVVVGVILAVDGPHGIATAAGLVGDHVGVVLVAAAVAGLVHNLAPRGTVIGPAVLAGAGVGALALRYGWWSARDVWVVVGAALVIAGGLMAVGGQSRPLRSDPARRVVAVLFRRTVEFRSGEDAPERLTVVAVFTRCEVDLRRAELPRYGPVEIMVSCWASVVTLRLPGHWPVVAGRVTAARHVRMCGSLDSTDPFESPEEKRDELVDLAAERQEREGSARKGVATVVHVVGVGGSVVIGDR